MYGGGSCDYFGGLQLVGLVALSVVKGKIREEVFSLWRRGEGMK